MFLLKTMINKFEIKGKSKNNKVGLKITFQPTLISFIYLMLLNFYFFYFKALHNKFRIFSTHTK
jgi:hypothetical protein